MLKKKKKKKKNINYYILFINFRTCVVKEGETATEENIKEFCRSKIAEFKIPKVVFIAKDFPRTATGKIQRRIVSPHFLAKNQNE